MKRKLPANSSPNFQQLELLSGNPPPFSLSDRSKSSQKSSKNCPTGQPQASKSLAKSGISHLIKTKIGAQHGHPNPPIQLEINFLIIDPSDHHQFANCGHPAKSTKNKPNKVSNSSNPQKTPSQARGKEVWQLSIEELESYVEDSIWETILSSIATSRNTLHLITKIKKTQVLMLPTLTACEGSPGVQPGGITECERWFKTNELIPSPWQLSPEAMAAMHGFPCHWFRAVSPPYTGEVSTC
ncbi:MAG: hypothetical protein F6K63_29890 [Moorea sp. SIO1G6]|uniref:hypothetical protein n=1 Tax=Moorena sp. SIO1G6 TaxID=2607840 RepID=UPI0013BFE84B|nr:hypothetical protein [Moorena sp. SIO1G6]NET68382.1 hypothetical protein [Moorena sp. SIO1G6]